MTLQPPAGQKQNGRILGYYVGFKKFNVSTPYMYITVKMEAGNENEAETLISKLDKFTRYSVHVQAYNIKGASPKSADINVLTLEDGKT